MNKLEEEVVYVANHNGIVGGAYVFDIETSNMSVATMDRIFNVAGWRQEVTDVGIGLYQEGGSYFEFSDLTLDSAKVIFPDTVRTFVTLENLTSMVKKVIDMADSYEVNTEPDEVVSFTVSAEGTAAAIIKTTKEGDLFTFVNGEWHEVTEDDEDPTIFELELLDFEPEDIGAALEKWKEAEASGSDLPKEELLPFVALSQ